MFEISMFLGNQCPKCGYAKLNVIKELGRSKYKCVCEKCKSLFIVDTVTNEIIVDVNKGD